MYEYKIEVEYADGFRLTAEGKTYDSLDKAIDEVSRLAGQHSYGEQPVKLYILKRPAGWEVDSVYPIAHDPIACVKNGGREEAEQHPDAFNKVARELEQHLRGEHNKDLIISDWDSYTKVDEWHYLDHTLEQPYGCAFTQ